MLPTQGEPVGGGGVQNLAIIVPYKIQGEFSVFITDITPDLEVIHHGQVFPMRVDEEMMVDNITDFALEEYQNHYNDKKITKEDIFYYTYGLLHHPWIPQKIRKQPDPGITPHPNGA